MMNQHQNKLAFASSPYLLQHAHNPVEWYEWGEEALSLANKENKPLLISIGYAACHWCHVMAHESFEDFAVAAFMNAHFINIKVDREERPDIDQVYMDAAQLISGRGGWPLNAFALPDGRPFYAGTYFPKEKWMSLLTQINTLYEQQFEKLEEQAFSVTDGIRNHHLKEISVGESSEFSPTFYRSFFDAYNRIIDFELGGYLRAPKFPLPVSWEFLLQYNYLTENSQAMKAVENTLAEMAKGGIYDQIGGGFSRYSVDASWKVPHFEKMLYDNGQLVSLYSHAWQVTNNPRFEEVIRQTLEFVERELMSVEGGFYSSLDADSEGEEGLYYTWTQDELEQAMAENELELLKEFYQIRPEGNWEGGRNILHSKVTSTEFAKSHHLSRDTFITIRNQAIQKLLRERSKRIQPGTDDKILTSWNAIMLKGYVDAYRALGNEHYLATALENAQFLENNLILNDGSLLRNYKNGKASIAAFLDDYAQLADALMQLYQVTFDKQWLDRTKSIADYVLNNFSDEQSSLFFYTSMQSESLVARKMEVPDNVIPSSNSVMAQVLYRLGLYFDEPIYNQRATSMLNQVEDELHSGGPYYANWAMLYGIMAYKPYEIAVVGREALQKTREIQRRFLPTSIFLGGESENLPLLENKLIPNETWIYVCKDKTCDFPKREFSGLAP